MFIPGMAYDFAKIRQGDLLRDACSIQRRNNRTETSSADTSFNPAPTSEANFGRSVLDAAGDALISIGMALKGHSEPVLPATGAKTG